MITLLDSIFSIFVLQQAIQSQRIQTQIFYFLYHPLGIEINRTDHRGVCLGENKMTV